MHKRPTCQEIDPNNCKGLELTDREALEPHVYSASPGHSSLEELRDNAAADYMDGIAGGKDRAVRHYSNADEQRYQGKGFLGSFAKGLPRQTRTGAASDVLPVEAEFMKFRWSVHTGNFFEGIDVPQLGPAKAGVAPVWRIATEKTDLRGWEAPEAGLALEPHGPDSHSVTMPAAPPLESEQLAFEMAEVYWLALLRDVPLTEFGGGTTGEPRVASAVTDLNDMAYAVNGFADPAAESTGIESRKRQAVDGELTRETVFRGATPGDLHGPYLSQFMLMGAPLRADGAAGAKRAEIEKGVIAYGSQEISQKQRAHKIGLDHMTDRLSFLDVQEGAKVGGDQFEEKPRFITTPRDLATYVHYDALYQAYLNACLMLMAFGAPVDPGIAPHNSRKTKLASDLRNVTDGFALFGGPHILNLVTEVSTRALKAVRYQKFNVHCRLRPEAVGGIIEFDPSGTGTALEARFSTNLIGAIKKHTKAQNTAANFAMRPGLDAGQAASVIDSTTKLLPMAFPEGSPMHPSYGAGHATVAGACVTILKAFFDTDAVIVERVDPANTDDLQNEIAIVPRTAYDANKVVSTTGTYFRPIAYVAAAGGGALAAYTGDLDEPLTVGGELNKLAANIAIARNMAGVHFYSDYIDSLLMGEEVAIRVLREAMAAFPYYPQSVRPSLSIDKVLGGRERISA